MATAVKLVGYLYITQAVTGFTVGLVIPWLQWYGVL